MMGRCAERPMPPEQHSIARAGSTNYGGLSTLLMIAGGMQRKWIGHRGARAASIIASWGGAAPSRGRQMWALAIGPTGEEAVLDVLHQHLGAAFAPPDLLRGVDRKQKGLVPAAIRAEQLVTESDLPLVAALDDEILGQVHAILRSLLLLFRSVI